MYELHGQLRVNITILAVNDVVKASSLLLALNIVAFAINIPLL